jgi:hypothetical protein
MMRGLVIVMLVVGVAAAAITSVVLWPRSFDGILPASMLDGLADAGSIVAPKDSAAQPADTPTDVLIDGPDGLVADGPIAAVAGNAPIFIDELITDHSTQVEKDVPSEITTIRPIMGCLLTPPLAGTVVGHVVAGQSDMPLGLLTYDDADLATAVQAFVDAYRQGEPAEASVPMNLRYQSYDVVVTETTAPVYLVLQTGPGNRIWNIHAAPGARIERVVLLGGNQVGVANLDPVVPVEVILQEGLETCNVRPALPLNAGHALNVAAASGDADAMVALDAHDVAVQAYDQWFLDTFGVAADPSRVGFDRGRVSLVGPVPGGQDLASAQKPAFAGIGGAKIRTTQAAFFEIPGQVAPGEDFASRVKAIASAFAFGDLANLRQGVEF